MEQLEPRMGTAAQKLQALLSDGLAEALREGNASARAHCLQAFSAVGDAASAEQVPPAYILLCVQITVGMVLDARVCKVATYSFLIQSR